MSTEDGRNPTEVLIDTLYSLFTKYEDETGARIHRVSVNRCFISSASKLRPDDPITSIEIEAK